MVAEVLMFIIVICSVPAAPNRPSCRPSPRTIYRRRTTRSTRIRITGSSTSSSCCLTSSSIGRPRTRT
uniref:Putative secreted protein n=1 Tax=Anopheles triannulatus TaxID=58253 RepID=A0A2M4B733_9DIPT